MLELNRTWESVLYDLPGLKKRLPNVIIVVVNGGGTVESVIKSFHSGGEDFFKKPYKRNLLAYRIEALNNKKMVKCNIEN